jgi:hypothetical protein
MRKIWGHLLFPFKFKFKFVLTLVNYCFFYLFRFCKMMFNFKFKLILRKKKYMSTIFLSIFEFQTPFSQSEILNPISPETRQLWLSACLLQRA